MSYWVSRFRNDPFHRTQAGPRIYRKRVHEKLCNTSIRGSREHGHFAREASLVLRTWCIVLVFRHSFRFVLVGLFWMAPAFALNLSH